MAGIAFPILDPAICNRNNSEAFEYFADSTNSNDISTKLASGVVVPISAMIGGFYADATEDGIDFVITDEDVTDVGLMIKFESDIDTVQPNRIGDFYGSASDHNALFNEYFGVELDNGIDFVISTDSGDVSIMPKSTAIQQQFFNVYGGETTDNGFQVASVDTANLATAKVFADGGFMAQLQADGNLGDVGLYFEGGSAFIQGTTSELTIQTTGNFDLNLLTTDGEIWMEASNENVNIIARGAGNYVSIESINQNIYVTTLNGTAYYAGSGIDIDSVFFTNVKSDTQIDIIAPTVVLNTTAFNISALGAYANDAGAQAGGVAVGNGYVSSVTGAVQRRLV